MEAVILLVKICPESEGNKKLEKFKKKKYYHSWEKEPPLIRTCPQGVLNGQSNYGAFKQLQVWAN